MRESLERLTEYNEFLNEADCRRVSGLSKSERFRRIKAGTFPAPLRIGNGRCTRWSLRSVLEWQRDLIEAGQSARTAQQRLAARPGAAQAGKTPSKLLLSENNEFLLSEDSANIALDEAGKA